MPLMELLFTRADRGYFAICAACAQSNGLSVHIRPIQRFTLNYCSPTGQNRLWSTGRIVYLDSSSVALSFLLFGTNLDVGSCSPQDETVKFLFRGKEQLLMASWWTTLAVAFWSLEFGALDIAYVVLWSKKWAYFDKRLEVETMSWLDLTENRRTLCGRDLWITRKPHPKVYPASSSKWEHRLKN